jgi:hypothetical protein
MMTTAYRLTTTGNTTQPIGAGTFAFGAGHVNPEKMLNPGLVLDSGFEDWSAFACTAAQPANIDLPASVKQICDSCTAAASAANPACTSSAALNLPSISLPAIVAGSAKVVTRRVTSVLNVTATFNAALQSAGGSGPLHVDSITPESFTLDPGASQEIQISMRIDETTLGGGWSVSSATLQSDQGTVTRIPIAAKASQFDAPEQVKPSKDAARFSYQITPGWRGTLDIQNLGLAAPVIFRGSMMSSNKDGIGHNITIPAGTSFLRISMFAGELQPASCCDLDLRLSQGLQVIGSSWTPNTADEQILMRSPGPGSYTVRVLGGYDKEPQRVSYSVYVWMLSSSSSSSSILNDVTAPSQETNVTDSDIFAAGSSSSSDSDSASAALPLQQRRQQPSAVSMAVSPVGRTPVRPGQQIDMQLSFSGVQVGGAQPKRYFGMIDYVKGKEMLGSTRIDIV